MMNSALLMSFVELGIVTHFLYRIFFKKEKNSCKWVLGQLLGGLGFY